MNPEIKEAVRNMNGQEFQDLIDFMEYKADIAYRETKDVAWHLCRNNLFLARRELKRRKSDNIC